MTQMEMQRAAGAGENAAIAEAEVPLTFEWLYTRVQGLVGQSIYPKAGPTEKWALRAGIAAAAIGLLCGLVLDRWIPPKVALILVIACLAVEVGGFLISGALNLRREYRQYSQPRLSHSKELDVDFALWQSTVTDIQRFPRKAREQRLRYVQTIRANMIDRLGLLYGGLQRLGPFPLLIALYVQYRSWTQGGLGGVFDVGLPGAMLIGAMVLLYVLAWVQIGQRIRLDTYVSLLEGSLEERGPEVAAAGAEFLVPPVCL